LIAAIIPLWVDRRAENTMTDYTLCFLYVEDDALSREILQIIMINAMGVHHLHVLEDSQDFMQKIVALPQKPDVILLDINVMPIDGFTMLQQIRADARYADTVVIALTASVMNEEVARLRKGGFNGAIAKPVNVMSFPSLIDRVLLGETVWHVV